jgi:hypothetical protein
MWRTGWLGSFPLVVDPDVWEWGSGARSKDGTLCALAATGSDLRGATLEDVQAALGAIRTKKDGSPVRPATVNTYVAAVKSLLRDWQQRLCRKRNLGQATAVTAGGQTKRQSRQRLLRNGARAIAHG